MGKVVEVDSTGQHGVLAVSMGQADAATANATCTAKTNGGLNWGLATGRHACAIGGSTSCFDCSLHTSGGSGYFFGGKNFQHMRVRLYGFYGCRICLRSTILRKAFSVKKTNTVCCQAVFVWRQDYWFFLRVASISSCRTALIISRARLARFIPLHTV